MRPVIALAVGLCLAGCTKPTVEGSLSEIMDLSYEKVELIASRDRSTGALNAVSVRFARLLGDAGLSEDVALEVGANLAPTQQMPEFKARTKVDLTEVVGEKQRGLVYRSTLDDPNHVFPPLKYGYLTLNTLPQTPAVPGQKISGSFSVTFELGTTSDNGRTAFKTFEAIVP